MRIPINLTFAIAPLARQRKRAARLVLLLLILFAAVTLGPVTNRGGAAQVEGGAVTGVIQDDAGAPVANAKVSISSADFFSSTLTQGDGRFEFRNLKPARYLITAEAERFRKEQVRVVVARLDEVIALPVIKLNPSSLHVAVLDANNRPLKGVAVALMTRERGGAESLAARMLTDEGGDAYFGRLSPGSYQLAAVLPGYEEYRNQVFISSGLTTEFPLQLLVAPVIPINEQAMSRYSMLDLPSKNVRAIFQDSDGWVWFGTDKGVARFNGSSFKSSAVAGSPYESLAGEDVRAIAEDRSGRLWLATARGVRRITLDGNDAGSALNGLDARSVSVDSRGRVWIATAEGAFKFEGDNFVSLDQSSGLPSNDARTIAEDKSGKIWIATASGVAIFDDEKIISFEQRLAAISSGDAEASNQEAANPQRRNDSATRAAASRPRSASSTDEQAARNVRIDDADDIFVDRAGTVWIATVKGVLSFDGNRVSRVKADALAGSDDSSSQGAAVRAMSQDRSGRMWFALDSGGALLYDPTRRESQRISFLDRDRVAAIYTGREGSTWFGTDSGAVRADLYSFVKFTTSRGLSDNDVREVVEEPAESDGDNRARLWFVTGSGVSRMQDERFVPVERFRANISVRAVAFDRARAAWFATDQGVFRLSGQTLTQLNEGNGLASNNVRWVSSIAGGILFATARGASIFKDGELRPLDKLNGYDVRHAFEDSDGRLWFATARGIIEFDTNTGETDLIDTARGLIDNDARWITRFKGKLLVATKAGVQVYNEQEANGMSFSTFEGGPASTLFVDRDGFLWIGTDDGQVKKFAQVDGNLVSTVYSGEAYALTGNRIHCISEDSQGHIWIASDKGAVRHIPVRVAPPVHISLQVDGHPDVAAENEAHNLPYGRHKLTFRFVAASVNGSVRYLWRIYSSRSAEQWTLMPAQQEAEREVPVFDIDAGNHWFEVIALNRDLYGAVAPVAALSLRVGQPFWKRWWFYTIALAIVGLAVASVLAVRRMRDREFVLPAHLRSYVAIEPNPYIVGNPIRSERMFFGREDDFRYVRTKLEGASQGVVIVFCGERRVGKSSILYQVLNNRLGDRFIPVFVDMQEMVIASDSEFFARISRLIAEAVARADSRAALQDAKDATGEAVSGEAVSGAAVIAANASASATISADARASRIIKDLPRFDGGNPFSIFLDFLDEVLKAIGDRTLLILLDEYEMMEAKVDEGKLSPEVFTFLAGLMDNKERLSLIFTGSRRLEERDKKYWRELLRRSLFRKVGFLSGKDTVRLITEPVEDRVVYGRGVISAICRLTAGQPFYAQVICQNTVDYMNEHRQNWVTLADLDQITADIIDNPLPQMIYTWDGLSDDEKLVLSLMSEGLPDAERFTTAAELRASVKANDYPVNLSENTIRLTLEEMFRRELLEKDAADGFRFKIDLLRLWICRSHSIWQVVKEVRTL